MHKGRELLRCASLHGIFSGEVFPNAPRATLPATISESFEFLKGQAAEWVITPCMTTANRDQKFGPDREFSNPIALNQRKP